MDAIVHVTDRLALVGAGRTQQETNVHKLVIAAAFVLAPAAASAQATAAPTGENPVGYSGSSKAPGAAYGPPAPTIPATPAGPRATPDLSAAAGTRPTSRHRGRHRGGYMEADGGVTNPQ